MPFPSLIKNRLRIEGFSVHPNIPRIESTYLQSAKMVDGIERHEKLGWSLVHCGMLARAEVERKCRFCPRTKMTARDWAILGVRLVRGVDDVRVVENHVDGYTVGILLGI